MSWPSTKVIRAALRGTHVEVFKAEDGQQAAGVRSAYSWILWTGQHAVCTRCKTAVTNPPPIELDKEKRVSIPTGGMVHAQHVLARLLHPFAKQHSACERPAA